jgi:ferredoxin-NADP reductase
LLTASGRPGFYFRVLQEGDVGAGDAIVKVGEAHERMTVAEINGLLYLPGHSHERLERALRIEALSEGWRESFNALLHSQTSGNAGLVPDAAAHPAAPGFRPLMVTAIDQECADVLSLTMQSPDGQPLPKAMPGQYVVLRFHPVGGPALFRSYSLSGPVSTERYRVSVKIELHGIAGTHLREHLRVHDTLDVSSPRGSFILQDTERPVVLMSAGIGVTPVLAMLYALSTSHSPRQVLWLHAARDGEHHPFAAEARRLLQGLTAARSYVCYSQPEARDTLGKDYNASGRLAEPVLAQLGLSHEADVYLCGPSRFMADMKEALQTLGVAPERIHRELFNGGESLTPGIASAATATPHLPVGDTITGPLVSFARSGIAAHWNPSAYQSILELAEACDVPVRWSCRTGVCHNCESGLVSGAISYQPAPLEKPAEGNLLICCSQPGGDVVVDL